MKSKLTLIYLCFICLCTSVAVGQNYKSWQLSINEGLAHNTIECVFKDADGFMWFGTHNGLNRYDGSQIKTYQNRIDDSTTISGNRVVAIDQDANGMFWVGTTRNGLNRFDKTTDTFHRYSSGRGKSNLPSNQIVNVKIFDDEVWVCTINGLALYNELTDDFENYFPDNLNENQLPFIVYDVLKTSSGKYYVATNSDCIYELNRQTGQFKEIAYKRDAQFKGNYRKRLVEDGSGKVWISAFSHGLVQLDPSTDESDWIVSKNSSIDLGLLNGNLVYADNKLWLASDGNGLIIYDISTGQFTTIESDYNKTNYLYGNKIYSLLIDEQGIIWLGTFNAGVNVLDPHQLKFNTLDNGIGQTYAFKGISILSIHEDKKGRIWIGTDGDGLFEYTLDGQLKHYKHQPGNANSLSSDRIVCIGEDWDGHVLMGTYMGGLVKYNPEKNQFTRYLNDENNPNSIGSDHVWDIFLDSYDRLWIGLLGNGLDLLDKGTGKFIHYGPKTSNYNRINHDNVMSIIEDSDGDIWFGTEGRGINILDKETRQMYHTIHSEKLQLANSNVRSLYQNSEGVICIGISNGGLNLYDKKSNAVEYYSVDDGMPNNIVNSIVEDLKGNLWLGTAYGLSRFNPENRSFKNFDIADGLQGLVCNRNALTKLSNGTILVGTTDGLSVFNPDSINDIAMVPTVFFTDLRIQNQLLHIGDSINGRVVLNKDINNLERLTFVPKDKIFTLEFAALTYTLPGDCQFMYKLEGFETDWKTTTMQRRHVTYSNLEPGNYIFAVKASNSDGLWSKQERHLSITVLPTFWGTIWFKLIIALIVLLVFYFWYRYKMGLKDKQFEKEKQVHEKKIVHLEKENLESELNNQTFNILSRNRSLLKHKRRLGLLLNKVDEKTGKTLKDIIQEIDQEISDEKDWKHIEPRLDSVYNNFMTTLKSRHENLTQNELRIAAYVRMGLSTKEISEIMQKTVKAIDNERYRLRKKLDIPQNNSLKKYLLDL